MSALERRPATPAEALAELLAGNRRFVSGTLVHPHQDAERRAALAAAQQPFAVLFGCSDSRLAAEIIFDLGLGDLFVVRTAGHVIGPEVLASIQYGVTVLGAPLVVVLGHDSCGAVLAATDAVTGGQAPDPGLAPIVDRVTPTIRQALADQVSDLGEVVCRHVRRTVAMLVEQNPAIAEAVSAGRCGVVGLAYRLADGQVAEVAAVPQRVG